MQVGDIVYVVGEHPVLLSGQPYKIAETRQGPQGLEIRVSALNSFYNAHWFCTGRELNALNVLRGTPWLEHWVK